VMSLLKGNSMSDEDAASLAAFRTILTLPFSTPTEDSEEVMNRVHSYAAIAIYLNLNRNYNIIRNGHHHVLG